MFHVSSWVSSRVNVGSHLSGYPLPHIEEQKKMILRVVVRESMSLSLVNQLFVRIFEATKLVMDASRASVADVPHQTRPGKNDQSEFPDWHVINN